MTVTEVFRDIDGDSKRIYESPEHGLQSAVDANPRAEFAVLTLAQQIAARQAREIARGYDRQAAFDEEIRRLRRASLDVA